MTLVSRGPFDVTVSLAIGSFSYLTDVRQMFKLSNVFFYASAN